MVFRHHLIHTVHLFQDKSEESFPEVDEHQNTFSVVFMHTFSSGLSRLWLHFANMLQCIDDVSFSCTIHHSRCSFSACMAIILWWVGAYAFTQCLEIVIVFPVIASSCSRTTHPRPYPPPAVPHRRCTHSLTGISRWKQVWPEGIRGGYKQQKTRCSSCALFLSGHDYLLPDVSLVIQAPDRIGVLTVMSYCHGGAFFFVHRLDRGRGQALNHHPLPNVARLTVTVRLLNPVSYVRHKPDHQSETDNVLNLQNFTHWF